MSKTAADCPHLKSLTVSRTAALAEAQARPQYDCPVVTDYKLANEILRSADVVQAGRGADRIPKDHPEQLPVFFLDGEIHKLRRIQIARFFTPAAMTERYRSVIDVSTAKLLTRLRKSGRERLDLLSFELACDVASDIIGLTNSNKRAMANRIRNSFVTLANKPKSGVGLKLYSLRQAFRTLLVFGFDVMPAIRARRKERSDDLISLLLDEGYSTKSIFVECQTYGSAGMMTTREFIVVAAWQLLDDPELRQRYLEGDEQTQFSILDEILRLDPVVTFLHRRATKDFTTSSGEQIKEGQIYALDLRSANLDQNVVGEAPDAIDLERARRQRQPGAWLSFGNGAHRCPGWQVALHETRVFLDEMLRVPGIRLAKPPTPTWTGTTYELHGAYVECDRA